MLLLQKFWLTHEALGEDFKERRVRLNPNSPMTFMSDITNKENEEDDIDIGIFEV